MNECVWIPVVTWGLYSTVAAVCIRVGATLVALLETESAASSFQGVHVAEISETSTLFYFSQFPATKENVQ